MTLKPRRPGHAAMPCAESPADLHSHLLSLFCGKPHGALALESDQFNLVHLDHLVFSAFHCFCQSYNLTAKAVASGRRGSSATVLLLWSPARKEAPQERNTFSLVQTAKRWQHLQHHCKSMQILSCLTSLTQALHKEYLSKCLHLSART